MSTTLADLLFWVVALIALFLVLRWIQKRKAAQRDEKGQD